MFYRTVLPLSSLVLQASTAQQQETSSSLPWWEWLLIILILALIFWLILRPRPKTEVKMPPRSIGSVPVKTTEVVEPPVSEPLHHENLTNVEVFEPKPAKTEEIIEPAISEPVLSEPMNPDDLTVIEGIGPKIKSVLNAAGISSFTQLASLDAEKIKEILTAGGIRLAETTTWPEQARLATLGKKDELKAYQDTLKGGRTA